MSSIRLHPAEPAVGGGLYGLDHRSEDSLVHVVPVPFEATVSYGEGTARGPRAVKDASVQVDLLDPDVGRPHRVGVYLHPESRQVRDWSREGRAAARQVIGASPRNRRSEGVRAAQRRVNRIGEALNAWLEKRVGSLLDEGRIVGILGGDHAVPFGSIAAHARRHPGMGILHLDAHADMREAYEGFTWSHASIMHNVLSRIPEVDRIVQVGIRDFSEEELATIRRNPDRVRTFFDRDLRDKKLGGATFASLAAEVIASLPRDVYVSFDIDGLDPSLCPNTGTPVPGGLDFQETCALLSALVEAGHRVLGFDLVEVAPGPQGQEWDANVGARVLYKLLGAAVQSRVLSLSPIGS